MGKKKEKQEAFEFEYFLYSALNHSVIIAYDGSSIVVPPRGKEKIGNHHKLGAIPKGIKLVKALKAGRV